MGREELREGYLQVLMKQDPELSRLVHERLDVIGQMLGESPEAWRGAGIVGREMAEILRAVFTDRELDPDRSQAMVAYMLTFASLIWTHPMVPDDE